MSRSLPGRLASGTTLVAGLLLCNTAVLTAQAPSLGVGGGVSVPVGDYASTDGLGWHGMALGVLPIGSSSFAIRLDGTYCQTGHTHVHAGHTGVWGGTADLMVYMGRGPSSLQPYLLAGAGIYHVSTEIPRLGSPSETKPALAGGLGVSAPFGASRQQAVFFEIRFVSVRTSQRATNFVPITVGLTFALH